MNPVPFAGLTAHTIRGGFTLIELLVTMTIVGILTALAIPALSSFILNDRDIGQINSMIYSLNYARSEAIKRDISTGITVCPSTNGTTCSGTLWSGGWIVTDTLGDVLQAVPALAGSNTLTVATTTGSVSSASSGITFLSSGMLTPSASITIKICDTRGAAFAREAEVNSTGRVVSSQYPGYAVNHTTFTCP